MLKAGVPLPIQINRFIYELNTIGVLTQTVTTSTFAFTSSLGGVRVCNDFAFDADKTMLVIADSILNGIGVNYGSEQYSFLLREYFYTIGKSTRCILKGNPSYKSANVTALRKTGQLMPTAPDLILYAIGTNDDDLAAFQAEFPSLLAHKKMYWPDAHLICVGTPPRQGANETTVQAPIRAYIQATVLAENNAKIHYCNIGNAFSNVGDTYYITTDATSAGSRVHPNTLGHAAIFEVLKAFIIANNIKI